VESFFSPSKAHGRFPQSLGAGTAAHKEKHARVAAQWVKQDPGRKAQETLKEVSSQMKGLSAILKNISKPGVEIPYLVITCVPAVPAGAVTNQGTRLKTNSGTGSPPLPPHCDFVATQCAAGLLHGRVQRHTASRLAPVRASEPLGCLFFCSTGSRAPI
jgi:hypothetical protein